MRITQFTYILYIEEGGGGGCVEPSYITYLLFGIIRFPNLTENRGINKGSIPIEDAIKNSETFEYALNTQSVSSETKISREIRER